MVNETKDTLLPVAWSVRQVRVAIGVIGVLIPVTLLLGFMWLEGGTLPASISDYYYTHTMSAAFVALILALGLSLVLYQYKTADTWVSTAAGLFVICVALFPTLPTPQTASWQGNVNLVHHTCAGLFIACLAFMTLFLFTRSTHTKTRIVAPLGQTRANLASLARRFGWAPIARLLQPDAARYPLDATVTPQKRWRNQIYDLCGLVIVVCLALLIALDLFKVAVPFPIQPEVFWLETGAVWAFGLAWLVKGELFPFLNDRPDHKKA